MRLHGVSAKPFACPLWLRCSNISSMQTLHHLAALWHKVLHGCDLCIILILSAEYHIFRNLAVVDKPIPPESWQLYKQTKWSDIYHHSMMYAPKSRDIICDADPASCIAGSLFPPATVTMGHKTDYEVPERSDAPYSLHERDFIAQ